MYSNCSHMSQHPQNARYPDAIALAYDERNSKLTTVYNDHSIYVWDVRDIRRVGKSHSFLYHSACIWGVEMYPAGSDSLGLMPPSSFVTCSSDDTIRVWNLEKDMSSNNAMYKRNIYSNVSGFSSCLLRHSVSAKRELSLRLLRHSARTKASFPSSLCIRSFDWVCWGDSYFEFIK